MQPLREALEALGWAHPAAFASAFVAASLLVLWRMEALLQRGVEGTAVGTVVIPYCSGLGNLIFVFLMVRDDGPAAEVAVNSIVNNVTALTVLLALPALIWGLPVVAPARRGRGGKRRAAKDPQLASHLSRLSLLLSLAAVAFFSGAVWVLGRDGVLSQTDGAILVGLFLFWQCFQVFDALKHNLRHDVALGAGLLVDLVVIALSAWVLYESLDWLVRWLTTADVGFFRAEHLGWLTGWLLVLPNAVVALYYAARGRADVVYSSQLGDAHICIPLCLGLFALARPLPLPPMMDLGLGLLLAATAVHGLGLVFTGRLPRALALILLAGYVGFVASGVLP